MNVLIGLEQRYFRTPDGTMWTQDLHGYPFWTRYLSVFDTVSVLARVQDVACASESWRKVEGDGVRVRAVQYYLGAWEYLRSAESIKQSVRDGLRGAEAVILRVSSNICNCLEPELRKQQRPFGVEVVVDPYDVFSPGALRHPLRPLLRWWFPKQLRRQCRAAAAASYVTEWTLQKRYPCSSGVYSTHYSSVELGDDAFATAPRSVRPNRGTGRFRVVMVASLEQMFKGHDTLIDAARICIRQGFSIELVFIGDGRRRPEFEARAEAAGIARNVTFLGKLPAGAAVRGELDKADLFVLPSRAEGLPRAMIEAMARGLPCIGSTASGIGELLPLDDLITPGDVTGLAAKMQAVLTDASRLLAMSARNLERARAYREDALRRRRNEFYGRVRDVTESWMGRPGELAAQKTGICTQSF